MNAGLEGDTTRVFPLQSLGLTGFSLGLTPYIVKIREKIS